MELGLRDEGALALMPDHQSLLLQLADGLTHRASADAEAAAQLRLRGEHIPGLHQSGGDAALDQVLQLEVQGNVVLLGEIGAEYGIYFHVGSFSGPMPESRRIVS